MLSRLQFFRRAGISAKLNVSFGILIGLIVLIMLTWFYSIDQELQTEAERDLAIHIERTVLDMDRRMEKARRLHGDFFLSHARIGLAEAHVRYAQPSVRLISQAVGISSSLTKMISRFETGHSLDQRDIDLNLYLSSAKRFADTSIESIELITRLAAPNHGLEAQFENLSAALLTDFEEFRGLQDQFQEVVALYLKYKIVRKRSVMQSAFNTIFVLKQELGTMVSLQPGRARIGDRLTRLQTLGEQILATDTAIKQLFNDFTLQVSNVTPISQALLASAREAVAEAEAKVALTHRLTTILMTVLTAVALLFGVIVAALINRSVIRRITVLTESTARIRHGHLSLPVIEEAPDELGQLAGTFNVMTGRIRELVEGLERKVELRTRELSESERRFRSIASELPNLAVMGFGRSREVFFWNHASENLYGYSEDEAVGRTVEELIGAGPKKNVLRHQLADWFDKGTVLPPGESEFHDREGRPVQVFATYVVAETGTGSREGYAIHIDLADLKKAQAERLISESFYRNLFNYTSSGVVVLEAVDEGRDFIVTDLNQAAEKIEMLGRADVLECRVSELFPGTETSPVLRTLGLVWRTGEPEHFGPAVYAGGNGKGWRQGHIYRIPTAQVVVVYDDVTQEREAALERAVMEAKLQRAKKMEAIGLLAGGVAHDLNNILSGITGYPELLMLQLDEDSSLRKPLEAIHASGQRAAAVVADLLTVARGVASERRICSLNALVDEYLASPEHDNLLSHHPRLTCLARLGKGLPNLACSPVHLKKSLMNLVVNAAEASSETGTIVVRTGHVALEPGEALALGIDLGDYVVLEVEDSGPGIRAEDMEHIFEPFYSRKKMGRSGTGLGLTVVWNTVQDHAGGIGIRNSASGAVFTLYFPVAEEEAPPDENDGAVLHLGSGETVLVVDDEQCQQDIAAQMLERLGYAVHVVPSGERALAYLRQHRVDLVLLDMLMEPGINGRQTLERILQLHPDQQALIVSGYSEDTEVDTARRLGAGGFLQKPYTMKELGVAVHQLLALRRQHPDPLPARPPVPEKN